MDNPSVTSKSSRLISNNNMQLFQMNTKRLKKKEFNFSNKQKPIKQKRNKLSIKSNIWKVSSTNFKRTLSSHKTYSTIKNKKIPLFRQTSPDQKSSLNKLKTKIINSDFNWNLLTTMPSIKKKASINKFNNLDNNWIKSLLIWRRGLKISEIKREF